MAINGPVNGVIIKYRKGGGNIYWSWSADDNLDPAFRLWHLEAASGARKLIAKGKKPCAVHIDFGLDDLDQDKLYWEILCLANNVGTYQVHVQLYQGTETTGYNAISEAIQYDATVSAAKPSYLIKDSVKLEGTI